MIKLERPAQAPACIDGTKGGTLLALYKSTKGSVWQIEELKQALLSTTHNKCAYCETPLGVGSAYIEVEHFRHKEDFEDLAITWSNLLPACRRCNGKKGRHNVELDPIINPYEIDPREHFKLECCRLTPKTPLGRETLDVLALNDTQRLGTPRWKLADSLKKAVDTCAVVLERFKASQRTRAKNDLIGKIEDVLNECQPASSYSATAATALHSDTSYYAVVQGMKALGLWSAELQTLHETSRDIAFDVQGLVGP